MNRSEVLVHCLLRLGIHDVLSVPDRYLADFLAGVERCPGVDHIPVTREEDAVGIAAGLALAGRFPVIAMQNSGLGNAINALVSLSCAYRLPVLLLVSHRGVAGEPVAAQRPMGRVTIRLLDAIGVSHRTLTRDRDPRPELIDAVQAARRKSRPQAVLIPPRWWHS